MKLTYISGTIRSHSDTFCWLNNCYFCNILSSIERLALGSRHVETSLLRHRGLSNKRGEWLATNNCPIKYAFVQLGFSNQRDLGSKLHKRHSGKTASFRWCNETTLISRLYSKNEQNRRTLTAFVWINARTCWNRSFGEQILCHPRTEDLDR